MATQPPDLQGPYGERAESYLRLLIEAALRSGPPDQTARVRRAADLLSEAGILSASQASWILLDLATALRARGGRELIQLSARLRRLTGFTPQGEPGPLAEWRVIPGPDPAPGAHVMALILTADRALAPGTLRLPPSAGIPDLQVPPWAEMTAADDLGTAYRLTFANGSWAGSTWTGTIMLHPAPPRTARWLKLLGPNGPLLLTQLSPLPAGGGPALDVSVRPLAESPGERLLARYAEALLASLPPDGTTLCEPDDPGLDELVTTLEAAGALSALSPAPRQVAALCRLLGLAADRADGPLPEVPARWMTVVTHYGRRKHVPPPNGTAAIGAALAELDGARFAIAGLRSGGSGSFLYVVARGLRPAPHRPPPGLGRDMGFSWWVRDDAGGWHLGAVDEVSPVSGDVVLRLALLPPLGHTTATLTVHVTGNSRHVAANLPVRW